MVTFDISMSLDGFITGPDDDVDSPLGEGGERLHEWVYGLASWRERHGMEDGTTGADADVLEEAFVNVGAIVMGRRMFEVGVGPWGEDPPFHVPVFVVTHDARESLERQGRTTFHFVTGGIEDALAQAREAAGDKDVSISGGADVIRQYLKAGLVDEFQIHVVQILLGGGRPLFGELATDRIQLEQIRLIGSPGVTHLKFRVVK